MASTYYSLLNKAKKKYNKLFVKLTWKKEKKKQNHQKCLEFELIVVYVELYGIILYYIYGTGRETSYFIPMDTFKSLQKQSKLCTNTRNSSN